MHGQPGYIRMSGGQVEAGYGEDGTDGPGGKVWWGSIHINPSQTFAVRIGKGGRASGGYGTPGEEGEETTFGPYSSADGQQLRPDRRAGTPGRHRRRRKRRRGR